MTFGKILENLIIGPLKFIFESIFVLANNTIGHPGWAIVVLSLIMNVLVLPLYRRADMLQEEARKLEQRLHDGITHIKKSFSGDERMFILQTYYRQNNYSPATTLKGSISLLLEIPFFIAAYKFLSSLSLFDNVSFWGIDNLGVPDRLLCVNNVTINVLPILMTLINIISSTIYLKGSNLKEKVQLYAMAIFFLVLLYNSPACLVLYWTLNNVFSLGKNIVLRIIDLKKNVSKKSHSESSISNYRIFLLGMIFLTTLIGIYIPSVYIAASPQEYVDITFFYNPLWYIVSTFCLIGGLLLIWFNIFYYLFSEKVKRIVETLVWILSVIMLTNYMFFGTKLGIITSNLQYESGMHFSNEEEVVNVVTLCFLVLILYYIISNYKKAVTIILFVMSVTLVGISTVNVISIEKSVSVIKSSGFSNDESIPHFQLSQNGKNVVVIMLDRAMNEYIPYLFNENSTLKEQFDGFTYFSNTISFGRSTNFGTPALYGGYEYTPVEINKRDTETLCEKQNEALKVMPVTFLQNNYEVTVCDPSYANYHFTPDLSIYDEYPEINTYITKGKFIDDIHKRNMIEKTHRSFFYFSFMKTIPLGWQKYVYDYGDYNRIDTASEVVYDNYDVQVCTGSSEAEGISYKFMENYSVLTNLPNITVVTDDSVNTFLMLTNEMTHRCMLLQEPEYTPTMIVDNRQYDLENQERFVVDGRELKVKTENHMASYQTNMVALMKLGEWFDYLRQNNVYDNTRIIIVADHGYEMHLLDELLLPCENGDVYDAESNYPLLMVKDFGSTGFKTSTEFMTNADVPSLAMKDIIQNPINPYTNKKINSDAKLAHPQYIIISDEWDIRENNGNTFLPAKWVSVEKNIWDKNNWKFSDKIVVLQEHVLP